VQVTESYGEDGVWGFVDELRGQIVKITGTYTRSDGQPAYAAEMADPGVKKSTWNFLENHLTPVDPRQCPKCEGHFEDRFSPDYLCERCRYG
jgi:hypothetical protein